MLVSTDAVKQEHRVTVCADFKKVLELQPSPEVIVVDIPIGLLDHQRKGGRECDMSARKKLGPPRGSSVFPAPHRAVLNARTWEEVRGKGLNKQSFNLLPKMREVDEVMVMTPGLQSRVHESHPELAFMKMANKPMSVKKSKPVGRDERLAALEAAGAGSSIVLFQHPVKAFEGDRHQFRRKKLGLDDLIDAYAMCWVGLQIAGRSALRVSDSPPTDSKGLRMEMWY